MGKTPCKWAIILAAGIFVRSFASSPANTCLNAVKGDATIGMEDCKTNAAPDDTIDSGNTQCASNNFGGKYAVRAISRAMRNAPGLGAFLIAKIGGQENL